MKSILNFFIFKYKCRHNLLSDCLVNSQHNTLMKGGKKWVELICMSTTIR